MKKRISQLQYEELPMQIKALYTCEWQVKIKNTWHATNSPMLHSPKGREVMDGYVLIKYAWK